MSEKFNLRRFASYLMYDLRSAKNRFGLTFLVLGLMPLIIYFIWLVSRFSFGGADVSDSSFLLDKPFRSSVYFLSLVVLVCLAPVKMYGILTDRKDGSAWLMIPASRLEKFISCMLICILLPKVFSILYFCIDSVVCLLPTGGVHPSALFSPKEFISAASDICSESYSDIFTDFVSVSRSGTLFSLETMLWFLFWGLVFKRAKITKTVLLSLGLGFALTMIVAAFITYAPDLTTRIGERIVQWMDEHFPENVDLKQVRALGYSVNLLWSALLAWGVWHRLRILKH